MEMYVVRKRVREGLKKIIMIESDIKMYSLNVKDVKDWVMWK